MALNTDDVIRALEEFEPGDEDENDSRLREIFEGFRALPDRERAVPAIFALLERCVGAELGTPGPIVHELEAIAGYEASLRESVVRMPTALGVWMVNRILNSRLGPEARASWMQLLELASRDPRADEWVREDAADFLAHQNGGEAASEVKQDIRPTMAEREPTSIYTDLTASVGEAYGSPPIQALLGKLPAKKPLRKEGGGRASLTFKPEGVYLIFDSNGGESLLTTAILYPPGVDGFGGFGEPIEGRLPIASPRPSVHGALGPPSRTGGSGKPSGVLIDYFRDRYDFERYHLLFLYESADGPIRMVHVMSKECARDLNPDLREGASDGRPGAVGKPARGLMAFIRHLWKRP